MNDITSNSSPSRLTGRLKPVLGNGLYSFQKIWNIANAIIDQIKAESLNVKIYVPYSQEVELSLLNVLEDILCRVVERKLNKTIELSGFPNSPYLIHPDKADCWIIHNVQRYFDFNNILDVWHTTNPRGVVIATGPRELIEDFHGTGWICLPSKLIESDEGFHEKYFAYEKYHVYSTLLSLSKNEDLEVIFHAVAQFDAWDVPVPLSYLSKVTGYSKENIITIIDDALDDGILYWDEDKYPLIYTRSSLFARKYYEDEWNTNNPDDFDDLIDADYIHPENEAERFLVEKLLAAWLADGPRLLPQTFSMELISKFINEKRAFLKDIYDQGNADEKIFLNTIMQKADLTDFEDETVADTAPVAEVAGIEDAIFFSRVWSRTNQSISQALRTRVDELVNATRAHIASWTEDLMNTQRMATAAATMHLSSSDPTIETKPLPLIIEVPFTLGQNRTISVLKKIDGEDMLNSCLVEARRRKEIYWKGLAFVPGAKGIPLTADPETALRPSSHDILLETVMVLIGLDEDQEKLREVFQSLEQMTLSEPLPLTTELERWILYLRQEP